MRYLRKYNENSEVDRLDELNDFCQGSLAYLLDDKLSIQYNYYKDVVYKEQPNKKIYLIVINNLDRANLKWDDIKDHFIPFLKRLSAKYKLHGFDGDQDYVKFNYIEDKPFNFYRIIKDNIPLNYFWSILLKVEI